MRFSISVEGRYQSDKIIAFAPPIGIVIPSSALIAAGTYAPNSVLAQATYNNFTPRVIVNYDVSPDMMIYASWSKGVNPSQFNTTILTSSDAIQTQAAQAGVTVAVEPEKLTNYEIGIKGRALNGAIALFALSLLCPVAQPDQRGQLRGSHYTGADFGERRAEFGFA